MVRTFYARGLAQPLYEFYRLCHLRGGQGEGIFIWGCPLGVLHGLAKNFGYVFAGPAFLSNKSGKVAKPQSFVQGPIGANLFVAVTDEIAEPL